MQQSLKSRFERLSSLLSLSFFIFCKETVFPARIKRIPPSLLLLLQKRNRRIYIPSPSTIYKWLHNYCDVHSREWFDPIFELNVLRWFPNWRELVLKTIFIDIRINKLIIFSILIFTVTTIYIFINNTSIEYSAKRIAWKRRPIVSLNSHIRFPLSLRDRHVGES